MESARIRKPHALFALAAALVLVLGIKTPAFAAETIVTHDGDEIRAALEKDGDVEIRLDAYVTWSAGRMTDREMTPITLPCAHTDLIESGLHPDSHPGRMQFWASLGSGSKTIDLAGQHLDVSVDDAGKRWDETDTQLYLFNIPAGASLTVEDSSGTNSGRIKFDGYLHDAKSGAAGTHYANYYNTDVVYRHVFRVDGGDLTFNGGEIATRSKEQYVSPGRPWDSVIGSPYSGDVRQQVNCVAITLLSGDVVVNGGIIAGRGYRFMYSGDVNEGLWYSSEYWPAAAIYAENGNVTINDGTIMGMGCANALDVYAAAANGGKITVRGGTFSVKDIDKVLVPAAVSNTGNSGTGAPRYMSGSFGRIGLHADFIDWMATTATTNTFQLDPTQPGFPLLVKKYDYKNFYDFMASDGEKPFLVTVDPADDAPLYLYDEGTGSLVEKELVWDGTSSRKVYFDLANTFPEYPWRTGYYQAIAESSKDLGVTSTVIIGGQTHHAGGEVEKVEKTVELGSTDIQTMIDSKGRIEFDIKDLVPAGMEIGSSFLVRIRYSENLMPYDGASCTQALTHMKTFSVVIEPATLAITTQPDAYYLGAAGDSTVLSATASGATKGWWYQIWPQSKNMKYSSFNETTGTTTLEVPFENTAHYYRCYFTDGFDTIVTKDVCVRTPLDVGNDSTTTPVTLYTGSSGGSLAVTGDLYDAFRDSIPSGKAAVKWYKDGSAITEDARVYTVPSTPHLDIKNPVMSDAGIYRAEITVDMNGTAMSYWSEKFKVTVIDGPQPDVIDHIELFGIGELYLGDIAPELNDISVNDDRYYIDTFTWGGGGSSTGGEPITVPTAHYEITLVAKDGYSFAGDGSGLLVTMNGRNITPTVRVGSIPGRAVATGYAYAYPRPELTERVAPEETTIQVDPDDGIIKSLKPGAGYNSTGQIIEDSSTGTGFSSENLPSWLSLSADGSLALIGEIPESALGSQIDSSVTYKTSLTGAANELSSGITFNVLRRIARIAVPDDLSEVQHVHTWGDWTDNGDNTHSRTCTGETGCGAVETANHRWDEGEVTKEASATSEGTMTFTCEDCGATKTEPIAYELHANLTLVEAKAPTCTEAGSKAYYICEDCGLLFWDEKGEQPILDDPVTVEDVAEPEGISPEEMEAWVADYEKRIADAAAENAQKAEDKVVIPATGHSWGDWKSVTAPTATAAGKDQRVCANDASHVEERTTWLISYNLNGGTLDGKTGTVTLAVVDGQTITLPAPTRTGYTFSHWQGSTYHAGDSYTVNESHTFTAQWTENKPSTPPAPSSGGTKPSTPRTGDATPVLWPAIATACTALSTSVLLRRKRER